MLFFPLTSYTLSTFHCISSSIYPHIFTLYTLYPPHNRGLIFRPGSVSLLPPRSPGRLLIPVMHIEFSTYCIPLSSFSFIFHLYLQCQKCRYYHNDQYHRQHKKHWKQQLCPGFFPKPFCLCFPLFKCLYGFQF